MFIGGFGAVEFVAEKGGQLGCHCSASFPRLSYYKDFSIKGGSTFLLLSETLLFTDKYNIKYFILLSRTGPTS